MKYTPGLLVGQLSGKAGSTVASRNRNGSYLRTKVSPVQPFTQFQLNARDLLTTLSQSWRGLSQAQRTAWNEAGALRTYTDSLGSAYTLTGQQLYISVNTFRILLEESPVDLPPSFDEPPSTDQFELSIASNNLILTVDTGPLAGGLLIYATNRSSAGRQYFGSVEPKARRSKGAYKLIAPTRNPGGAINLTADWAARYGTFVPTAPGKYSVQALPISPNGYPGSALRDDLIVT